MNKEEIKRELREAFGLGKDDARIEVVERKVKKELGLDDLELPDVYWAVVCTSSDSEARKVRKFDLDSLNRINEPIILSNWTFECEIMAQEKKFGFPIVFHRCRVDLKDEGNPNQQNLQESINDSTHQFSEHFLLCNFEFKKDVIFSAIEFTNVFENTQFQNVTFCNQSKWCRHDQDKKEFSYFSFDGISVKERLVLQDLKFGKGDLANKTVKEILIVNCSFAEEVKFNGLTLDTLTLSEVEFKEQVSFVELGIKELIVQRDLRKFFDFAGNDHRPLKNTTFSKMCLFTHSNLGSLEFGDGTEFQDLIIQDTTMSEKLSLHARMKGILNISTQEEQSINVDFSDSIFEKGIEIDLKITLVSPKFCSCTFKKPFHFKNLNCEGEIDFSKAVFEDEVIFGIE